MGHRDRTQRSLLHQWRGRTFAVPPFVNDADEFCHDLAALVQGTDDHDGAADAEAVRERMPSLPYVRPGANENRPLDGPAFADDHTLVLKSNNLAEVIASGPAEVRVYRGQGEHQNDENRADDQNDPRKDRFSYQMLFPGHRAFVMGATGTNTYARSLRLRRPGKRHEFVEVHLLRFAMAVREDDEHGPGRAKPAFPKELLAHVAGRRELS